MGLETQDMIVAGYATQTAGLIPHYIYSDLRMISPLGYYRSVLNMNVDDELKGPNHLLVADCPDCGRVVVHRNRCGKCYGSSWLPAGYFSRMKLRKLVENVGSVSS